VGPFRCTTCGAPSDHATTCASCGARTFVLAREARNVHTGLEDEPARGQLVSIADAPSLRLGHRRHPRRAR
jgi:DNA-directed RNA polymerase subunit RPC12/RpoP